MGVEDVNGEVKDAEKGGGTVTARVGREPDVAGAVRSEERTRQGPVGTEE